MHGKASENPADTMMFVFNSWRLSNFDLIFNNYSFDLNGIANGFFGVSSVFEVPNFFSSLYITDLVMNDVIIGDADIQSSWKTSESYREGFKPYPLPENAFF